MNSQPLDMRFLRTHPRTALWFEQRAKCERCRHCVQMPALAGRNSGTAGMRCEVRKPEPYCIDMRDEGIANCGPEGRFFLEKP